MKLFKFKIRFYTWKDVYLNMNWKNIINDLANGDEALKNRQKRA